MVSRRALVRASGTNQQISSSDALFVPGNLELAGAFSHRGASITLNPASQANAQFEFGYTGGAATTPYFDWHCGAVPVDYDVREIVSGGDGTAGGGIYKLIAGGVSIGGAGSRTITLQIANTNLTGAVQYAVNVQQTFNTSVATTAASAYAAAPIFADASGTTNDFAQFRALNPSFSGSSAQINNFESFYAQNVLSTYALTAYAFRGALAVISGVNRWNLYMDGAAPNYLNGDLRIGTTTQKNTDKLSVTGSFSCTLPASIGTYTLSTLPSASSYSGYLIQVSNASRGWALCRSNGTSWIDLYTQAAVA